MLNSYDKSRCKGMEDRTFALLEKMYSDFSKKFEKIESEISEVKSDIKKIGVKIDGPITEKIKSLEDGYKVTYEKLVDVEKKLDSISDKVDKHDIKIEVIEGGKKKNIK